MVLGGATALASILARRSNPVSSASTQSRIHWPDSPVADVVHRSLAAGRYRVGSQSLHL